MQLITGVVLIEIVDRDVITWRVSVDPLQELIYSMDTAAVPGVAVFDLRGRIEDASITASATANKTFVQFRKRSDYYGIFYRRSNVLTPRDEAQVYNDSWRYQGLRWCNWFFPPSSRIEQITPGPLAAYQGRWRDQPILSLLTPGLTVGVHVRPAAGAAPPDGLLLNFPDMLRQLAPPDGAPAQTLRQVTLEQPEYAVITAGATAIPALLRGEWT